MRRFPSVRGSKPGFLLMEVLLGIALFGLFVSAVGFTLLYGQESSIMSGDRIRATMYAEKTLEAARTIRDVSFSSLTPGQKGVGVDPSANTWVFSGSQITESGGYVAHVTVSSVASDWVRLTAQTTWKRGYSRSGSVLLTTEMTDWRSPKNVGDWSGIAVDGTYTDGGTPVFNDLAIFSGSYVFLASQTGNGLYVIDVRNTASPSRVNGSFSLGTSAYDVAVRGSHLFVATSSSTQEIRVYDVSAPATFSSAQLIGSYDVPGSGRVRALALRGDMLYAGTTSSSTAGEHEFYALRVSSSGSLSLVGSLNDDGHTVSKISVSDDTAYLASSSDTSELRVVDVSSGSNLVALGGYNLSDRTLDGLSVAIAGTSALLGTQRGTSIAEVVLFDLEDGGVPSPPPGPWYHEGSGSVLGLDMDPSRCYGFIGALSGKKALQVFNVRNKSTLAELTSYDSTTGLGRGVLYDPPRDRLFFITDRSLIIFRPAGSTGTCS